MTPSTTDVAAEIPPSPAIDRSGRRRRGLDWHLNGHISRESGRSDQYGDGDSDCELSHSIPGKHGESIPCSLPGGCCRFSTVNLNFSLRITANQSADVRFTPKSGHSSSVSGCPLCAKSGH